MSDNCDYRYIGPLYYIQVCDIIKYVLAVHGKAIIFIYLEIMG